MTHELQPHLFRNPLKSQQILSLGVLEEKSGSKIPRLPSAPRGQRAAWCELEVDVSTVRGSVRVGAGGVWSGNDPQTQRHAGQAFHLGGKEGRERGEGERGGREGRERGDGERGGREGRERGEGERGGREGRERGEGERGGREGRERGEGKRGGREGRERGEDTYVRIINRLMTIDVYLCSPSVPPLK